MAVRFFSVGPLHQQHEKIAITAGDAQGPSRLDRRVITAVSQVKLQEADHTHKPWRDYHRIASVQNIHESGSSSLSASSSTSSIRSSFLAKVLSTDMIHKKINHEIIATRRHVHEGKTSAWERLCREKYKEFNLINCITALHIASQCKKPWVLMSQHGAIIDNLLTKIDTESVSSFFSPHNMTNLLYILAKLKIKEKTSIINKIIKESITKIDEFNPQSLANTFWAMGKLGIKNDCLITVLTRTILKKLENFNSLDLTNTVYGCAKLDLNDPPFMTTIADAITEKIASFEPTELANTAWAFAKLGINYEPVIEAIATAVQIKIEHFSSQHVPYIAWAFAVFGIRSDPLMHSIYSIFKKNIKKFSFAERSNIILAFDILGIKYAFSEALISSDPPSFSSLSSSTKSVDADLVDNTRINEEILATQQSFQKGDTEALAQLCNEKYEKFNFVNCMTALDTASQFKNIIIPLSPYHEIIGHLIKKIEQENWLLFADLRNIINLISIFARLNTDLKNEYTYLLNILTSIIIERIKELDPHELANIAYAFSTLRIKHASLMEVIANAARIKIATFTPHELANIVWAFANLRIKHEPLMEAIAHQAKIHIAAFPAQELANTLWSFAILGVRNDLLEATADVTMKLSDFNSQSLANISWAFATFRIRNDSLMKAIADRAITKISNFYPHELANIAVAFAKLDIRNAALMEAIARVAVKKIATFTSPGLANITWAFDHLHIDTNRELLQAISTEALVVREGQERKLDGMSKEMLFQLVSAYSTLGIVEANPLMEEIANYVAKNRAAFLLKELAAFGMHFAIFAHLRDRTPSSTKIDGALFFNILEKIAGYSQTDKISRQAHYQTQTMFLYLDAAGMSASRGAIKQLQTYLERTRHLYSPPSSSPIEKDVENVLQTMTSLPIIRKVPVNGLYIDLALSIEEKLGINVHDSSCFLQSGNYSGTALFRKDMLEAYGWKLISILVKEWSLLTTLKEKQSYLHAKILEKYPSRLGRSSEVKPAIVP